MSKAIPPNEPMPDPVEHDGLAQPLRFQEGIRLTVAATESATYSTDERWSRPAWRHGIKQLQKFLSRQSVRRKAAVFALGVIVPYIVLGRGLSFRELIIGFGALVLGLIVFSGERGIQYGFALWVLTLALGYRTIPITLDLHIHPSEILLWVLLACVCVHRQLVTTSRLTFPLWMWLMMPFWVLAWWPIALGNARWDQMLNEFRDFLLLVPLIIVATVALRQRDNWRRLLLALFVASTWIAVMGILEFWVSGISGLFPAFMTNPSAGKIEGFERAMFSFWGGPMATFICALALPFGIVAVRWWPATWQRTAIIGSSIAQGIAIYIAGYRSIWFFVMIEILLACLLSLKHQRVTIAAACLVVILGGYQFVPQAGHQRAFSGIEALQGRATDSSAKDRISRAQGAWDQMIASPLGNGWSASGWVHSDFLQVGANLGLLGGLIFLGGYLYTLARLFRRVLSEPRSAEQGDLGVSLLLAYISAGGILATQGVEVLPQLILPVWFVWVLVEVWLRQPATAYELGESPATVPISAAENSSAWWPAPFAGSQGVKQ
ncbi:MAG: hypothetical protein ACMG6H_03275 [Acidobacteriota bacterium]